MATNGFSEECDIVAILSPRPGKQERIIELLSNLTKAVEKNEDGVFSFHLYRDFDQKEGQEQLVLVEKYSNMKAYDAHAETPEFKAMHATFKGEDLMAAPIVIKSVKPVEGFAR